MCKTCSTLNACNAAQALHAIYDEACSTGSTLRATLIFMQRAQPRFTVLENVKGLERAGQAAGVQTMLWNIGFWSVVISLTPLAFGHPQSRPRLYFICVRRDLLVASGVCGDSLALLIRNCFSAMHRGDRGWPLSPVDSFLLSDDDPFLQEQHRIQVARVASGDYGKLYAGRWVQKHVAMGSLEHVTSHWEPELAHVHPAVALLPARTQDMLDMADVSFPEDPHTEGRR